jgi:adenosylcobinamide kinase / adenosylcobinamide-phosphate guanylyltransferase
VERRRSPSRAVSTPPRPFAMPTLILGGARSGKSGHAQRLAEASGLAVTLIATARAGDEEMRARIARHRSERPPHWNTVEEPLALAEALAAGAETGRFLVVDCLTLWLLNVLEAGEAVFRRERAALLAILPDLPGRLALVANEVGLGVIPLGELSRRFVDEAGRLNQDLARVANEVVFVAAGLPMTLKGRMA